jgi:hypothetical protein
MPISESGADGHFKGRRDVYGLQICRERGNFTFKVQAETLQARSRAKGSGRRSKPRCGLVAKVRGPIQAGHESD